MNPDKLRKFFQNEPLHGRQAATPNPFSRLTAREQTGAKNQPELVARLSITIYHNMTH